jgi:uncharacterized damage-inducible protein DinB
MTLVAAVALTMAMAAAQTKAPAKAPRPAAGASTEALAAWNDIGRKLIAMAEDWPEDKYDWKPTPQVRSFAEQVLHVAGANYFFTNTVLNQPQGPEDLPRDKYKTKAEVVEVLKKSFADGAAAIKSKGDAGMATAVKHPFGNRMVSAEGLCYDLIEHGGEHYGQLVLYYRVNGGVPPESRPRQ